MDLEGEVAHWRKQLKGEKVSEELRVLVDDKNTRLKELEIPATEVLSLFYVQYVYYCISNSAWKYPRCPFFPDHYKGIGNQEH